MLKHSGQMVPSELSQQTEASITPHLELVPVPEGEPESHVRAEEVMLNRLPQAESKSFVLCSQQLSNPFLLLN